MRIRPGRGCSGARQGSRAQAGQSAKQRRHAAKISCTLGVLLSSPEPHLSPHTASSRHSHCCQRGCETKGHGSPAGGLGSPGRWLRGTQAGESCPERAQIGLVLASQAGAASRAHAALCGGPCSHQTQRSLGPCSVQVQCSSRRCNRAGWQPCRRGRQAGPQATRLSYPFSRQRDASSQAAALRQPRRSALASHRHLQGRADVEERAGWGQGTFGPSSGGAQAAAVLGVEPAALIPAPPAPTPRPFSLTASGEARPACLRPSALRAARPSGPAAAGSA